MRDPSHAALDPTGVAHAVIAYGLGGFAPIYWKEVARFPAPERLAYRVLASLAVAIALVVAAGARSRGGPMSRAAAACAAAWLLACTPSVEPIVSCATRGAAHPLCGFQNPEDLVALPGGRALLVSEYGGMVEAKPGRISRLDLATGERTVLFEAGDGATGAVANPSAPTPGWGDPECRAPTAFSPHGIDLVRRRDGLHALLVVNHADRESVELFEVLEPEAGARIEWRGCVIPPAGSWLNEVAGLPDGGLLVSHMLPRREGLLQLYEPARAALFGAESGHVIEWSPSAGFSVVPGSECAFANGVAVSPDGARVFVNATLGGTLRAIDRRSGERLHELAVASPDNLSWTADGRLLLASLTGSPLELRACDAIERGACPTPFEILSVDPETFASELVYRSDGATMGAGTVGLQVGSELFVGSFAGDRILRVSLSGDAP